MTVPNPQKPSNTVSANENATNRFFSNFFVPDTTISQNDNDYIVSFFQAQTNNKATAILLAQALINTANAQRENPIDVLNQFQKQGNGDLTPALTLYLNSSRVNTSLLGLKNAPVSNKYVARTILP